MTLGLLLFEDVEELDFVGPWEVFTSAAQLRDDVRVLTLAEREGPLRCAKGLRVLPDLALQAAPKLDLLLVPGGQGTRREVGNARLIEWLRGVGPGLTWLTSVCTGSLLLCEAGLPAGTQLTTHWAFVETLRKRYPALEVLDDVRYVHDGRLCSAAGVSAGIDMALWLTGQLWGIETARTTQRAIQYDPEPPYANDE